VAAIFEIQVLSAFDAQAFAVRVMERFDWHFEQGIFMQKGARSIWALSGRINPISSIGLL